MTENKNTLIWQFNLIDAIEIQQMLWALHNGYKIKSIQSKNGLSEFKLTKGKENARNKTSITRNKTA